MALIKKAVPMWIVLLLIVALVGVGVAWAASTAVTTTEYAATGGVNLVVSDEVTMTCGTMAVPSGQDGPADADLTGVVDTDAALNGNVIAATDYVFRITFSEIAGTTPATEDYTVSLYADGALVASALTVTSNATLADAGADVDCYWSLGSTLSDAVYYATVEPA